MPKKKLRRGYIKEYSNLKSDKYFQIQNDPFTKLFLEYMFITLR